MRTFRRLCGVAAPVMAANIDTGSLAPSQWSRDHPGDLGSALLREWRIDGSGAEFPDFVLNRPRYRQCRILIAGPNFGCGSARETAVWALLGYGIRCVVASSFGEIFFDNAFQNGLLLVALPRDQVAAMAAAVEAAREPILCVDLETCTIGQPGLDGIPFRVAADRRAALLEGRDETLLLRECEPETAAFRTRDRARRPWVYGRGARQSADP